jgi:CubicO group peptidase (beta-lactamase class C family)
MHAAILPRPLCQDRAVERPLDRELLDAIDRLAQGFVDQGRAPALAYGVVADGRLIGGGGAGRIRGADRPPSTRAVFRIASMTKSVTAAAVLLLRDEGRISLDEPIATYVPEAVGLVPSEGPPLTLRLLLTMSAGFPSDDPWADRQEQLTAEEFGSLLRGGPRLSARPGTVFQYSNLGYAIAGAAVEAVSGEPFRDFAVRRLLAPLGLGATRFSASELRGQELVVGHRRAPHGWVPLPFSGPGAFSPIGGLFSTVEDLAVWVGGFLAAHTADSARTGGGSGADGHPLSTRSRLEMQQMQRLADVSALDAGGQPHAMARGYGLGLVVERGTRWGEVVSHSGGYPGFGSHMRWHPASGLGVVMLANATYAGPSAAAAAALELLLADRGASPGPAPWPEVAVMREAVETLLVRWDDALADAVFAVNMDLDVPRAERRAAIESAAGLLGPVDAARRDPGTSPSAAALTWHVHGTDGSLRVAMTLSPEPAPRIQSLSVDPLA